MATMTPATRIEKLPSLFFAQLGQRIAALQAAGADVIRLDAGSPDMPPAPILLETLKKNADDPTKHGYGGYAGQPHLRQAIAYYYGRRFGVELEDNELLPLIGSKEGVVNLHLAWLDPGDLSLIPDPSYPSYAFAPLLAGGRIERFPLLAERAWLPDFKSIPEESARKARMLWLNYPNNPTGATATLEFFAEAVDFCRRYNILLCHDAPYVDVTFNGYRAPSVLQAPGAKEVAIEFNSLSKTYNMAGWRVGMAVGNRIAIEALARVKTQIDSGMARPVQDMAAQALQGDQGWLAQRNAIYQERRDICLATLHQVGLEAETPRAALYVWFRAPSGYTSLEFHRQLLEEAHISITPGHIFGPNGEGWMRISLAVATDRLQEALNRMISSIGNRLNIPGSLAELRDQLNQ
jgi:LL-diaminopimelate aminotransferase